MHLRILKALAGLLAISPLLHAAPAAEPAAPSRLDHSTARSPSSYLRRRDDVYDKADSDSILEEYKAWTGVTDDTVPSKRSEDSDVDTYALAKRLQALDLVEVSGGTKVVKRANPRMNKMAGWDDTWIGFVREETGWTADTIKGFAQYAYADMMAQGANPYTVVSALWIPGKGCYLGSLPKDNGQVRFAVTAPNIAPTLWHWIKNRRVTVPGDYAKYHAEDMACFEHERWVARNTYPNGQYPEGSRIYSYGLTRTMATAGPIAACSPYQTGIQPSCQEAMHDLNVAV